MSEREIPMDERLPDMKCWGWAETPDSESWYGPYRTSEEAADAAREAGRGGMVSGYVQECRIVDAPRLASMAVDLESLLERANEDETVAWSDDPVVALKGGGEEAEVVAERALRAAIRAWAEQYLTAQGLFHTFWDSEPYPVEPKP